MLVLLFIRNEHDVSADKKADDHEAGKKGMRKYGSKLVLVWGVNCWVLSGIKIWDVWCPWQSLVGCGESNLSNKCCVRPDWSVWLGPERNITDHRPGLQAGGETNNYIDIRMSWWSPPPPVITVLCLSPDCSDLWALTPHVAGQEESERDVLVVLWCQGAK